MTHTEKRIEMVRLLAQLRQDEFGQEVVRRISEAAK